MVNFLNLMNSEYLYMSDYHILINACLKDRFLANLYDQKISINDIIIDEEMIKKKIKNLSQICFEVTENCNLRCQYCVYGSGHYNNVRKRSTFNMSSETAKKGLDYVFSFIKDRKNKQFNLSFYGGEPLMNIDTIKKLTEYAKKLLKGWNIVFNMTTNLTLYDDSVIDFLVKNNFRLLVSLDGGKKNHDAKRVFSDGKGSYRMILENLGKIKKQAAEYFDTQISFHAVYAYDLSFKNLYHFFSSNRIVRNKRMQFSMLSPRANTYYEYYPLKRDEYSRDFDDILFQVFEKISSMEKLNGIDSFIDNSLKAVGSKFKYRKFNTLAGACMFDSRLFLDARGRFHICEKVNNTFPIGDVESGFDFKKMVCIVNEYKDVIRKNCLNCDVRFLCTRCYEAFEGSGTFSFNPEFCEKTRKSIINELEEFIKYNEKRILLIGKDAIKPGKLKKKEKLNRFHQFVQLDKGPVNTAIIDFLRGNVYQVENEIIEKMEQGDYEEIQEFVESARQEELLIEVFPGTWIPGKEWEIENSDEEIQKEEELSIELHIEESLELDWILEKLQGISISKIFFYGRELPITTLDPCKIIKKDKNFQECIDLAVNNGNFSRITKTSYLINKKYNSCWGGTIAITADGMLRPCIHSGIQLGNITAKNFDIEVIMKSFKEYWYITKDKIKKCRDCELKYVCFDCREIALRYGGDLFSAPPLCNYDPHSGTWIKNEKEDFKMKNKECLT